MKTIKFLFVAVILSYTLPASAIYDKIITVDELPAKAKTFLKHFKDKQVAFVKLDKNIVYKEYEVGFVNGGKIEFNSSGGWTEIDLNKSEIPSSALPTEIQNYVKSNHSNTYVVQIERNRYSYEIDLSNGFEIKFDSHFRVKDIDK